MTMNAKFRGTCTACGCWFNAGEKIEWTRGAGARHATNTQCEEAKAQRAHKSFEDSKHGRPAPFPSIDLTPIVKFLQSAKDRGLKRPKLRVLDFDGRTEIRLGITTKGMNPGSLSVVVGGTYRGLVRPDGTVKGDLLVDRERKEHLLQVALNPAAAAKQYALLTCSCSFCGLPLEDPGSVEVGYGPVCAKHWGLPHKPMGTPSLLPVTVPSVQLTLAP